MKTNIRILILLGAFVLVLATVSDAAESLSVLLQKGIFAEETEGNLDAAIKIYEWIAKEADANRSLVAQAQYRLGVCQLKKGKRDEAASAFRKLIEQFSNETEIVAKSRGRLSELGQSAVSPVVRQVWAPAGDAAGSVSPDGRYYTFTDWDTGDLGLRDLKTQSNRRLTNKGTWDQSKELAMDPVFSRSGNQIAYYWYTPDKLADLRIVTLEDPKPRVILDRANSWCSPLDWSPDDKQLLALIRKEKGADIMAAIVSISDGAVQVLKLAGPRIPGRMRFSPNGRFIVLTRPPNEGTPHNDIFAFDLKSKAETPLIQHPADDHLVGWAPDGKRMLFVSDRRGSKDLWSIQVEDGKATSEPVLLRTDLGDVTSLGITRDNALYYGISRAGLDLYRATVDLGSGKVLSAPQPVPHPPSASGVLRASLSPNGRYLAYYLSRSGDIHWPELFLSELESGHHQQLYAVSSAQLVDAPRWLSDNRTLVHRGNRSDGGMELSLVDRQSGAVGPLDKDGTDPKSIMEIAGDNQALAYVIRDTKQKGFVMVRRDLKTGQETKKVLVKERDWSASYHFRITSDLKVVFYSVVPAEISAERPAVAIRRDLETGQELEFMRWNSGLVPFPSTDPSLVAVAGTTEGDGRTVRLFRFEENKARELWTAQAPGPIYFPTLFGFGWTSDKRYLIYHRQLKKPGADERQIWTIAVETGQVRQLEPATPKLYRVVGVHPDGKQLFFQASDGEVSEVWAMENFLPAVASTK